jgi:hypothetical protein
VRRPIQLIVCALIAAVAIGGSAPAGAATTARKRAVRSKVAHSSARPKRACMHCQMAQLRTTREVAPEPVVVERPPPDEKPAAEPVTVEARPVVRVRASRGKRRKPSLLLRAKIATLHLAEALHLYHPQPNYGGERPRFTEERVWFDAPGSLLGIDVGFTLSEITRVRGTAGSLEFIHVVGSDPANQNFETILKRIPLIAGQRLEVQGPAVNTFAGLPIGFRAGGLDLSSDLFEPGQNRAITYTLEAKLTERAFLYWAPLWAPGAASALDAALGTAGHSTIANLVGGALPFVSAALAVQSAVRAWRVFRNPQATRLQKALAVGHVVADGVRVALPVVGTLANVALIGVTAAVSYVKVKRARAGSEHPVDPRYLRRCAPGGCTD